MADAFKCDLTGKLIDGKAQPSFLVALSPTCSLLCYPQRKVNERQNEPGAVSPDAIAAITAALAKLKV